MADNATYAIGSVFFTTAAFVQLRLTGRWQPGGWRSAGWSDWWAAAVQFVGTLFFNVSTFSALFGGDHVWRPDAIGSVAFLVASVLAVHAVTIRDRLWDPTVRTWQIAWVNLAGSIAFGSRRSGPTRRREAADRRRHRSRESRHLPRRAVLPRRRAAGERPIPNPQPSIHCAEDGYATRHPPPVTRRGFGQQGREIARSMSSSTASW